ncbi:hypothetical protein IHE44_0012746 [Lamprotornis superbus]|uniref:Uncharacterized protein n=1 Tax=Lamprotornis superbus TaxID=245042 RepID=A0A835NES6_9PASS|nr:hypothetical protein IHE44_0012746 [Lamprotornis superbus]
MLRSAEEQERKIRAWVKLKLSQELGPGWDEESQHRMEEIKAELLPKPRKSAQARAQARGPADVLAEGRRSPQEAALVPEEAVEEQTGPCHPSAACEPLSSTSAPVRKFLSCVHITLSSRLRHPELSRAGGAGHGMEQGDKAPAQAQPLKAAPEASVEGGAEFPPAEGIAEGPSPAVPADPSQMFSSRLQGRAREGTPSSAPPAQPARRVSDAATQITVESATKTTLSAEVCVHPQEGGAAALQTLPSTPEAAQVTASSHKDIPPFPRQPAQPLLLPYKPWGSTGMYYVPYQRAANTLGPGEAQATGDSSHSGSEDAPAGFLTPVLALRDDATPARAAVQQSGTVHGHRAGPKLAWAEEQRVPLEQFSEADESRKEELSARAPLGHGTGMELPGAAGTGPVPPGQRAHPEQSLGRAQGQGGQPRAGLDELWVRFLQRQRMQQQQQGLGKRGQLSLVERLERLARLLQSPIGHSLAPAAAGEQEMQGMQEMQGREQPGVRVAGKSRAEPRGGREGERARVRHGKNSLGEPRANRAGHRVAQQLDRGLEELRTDRHAQKMAQQLDRGLEEPRTDRAGHRVTQQLDRGLEELRTDRAGHRVTQQLDRGLEEPRTDRAGHRVTQQLDRGLEEQQPVAVPSDSSSDTRLSSELSTCSTSGWDTGTPAGLDTSPASGDSSSVSLSTIDTARLLRAFGQHRLELAPSPAPQLAPQLAPKLAQLYRAIRQQRRRSEQQDEQRAAASAGCALGAAQSPGQGQQSQSTVPVSWDPSSSRGPSPALARKPHTRMLSKGIQADYHTITVLNHWKLPLVWGSGKVGMEKVLAGDG